MYLLSYLLTFMIPLLHAVSSFWDNSMHPTALHSLAYTKTAYIHAQMLWFHVQFLHATRWHVGMPVIIAACCVEQLHMKPHLKHEAFEKCWAHSPLRAAARPNFTLPFTRCRYCCTPPLTSHAACTSMSTTTREWQRGPLWLHRMGPLMNCMQ